MAVASTRASTMIAMKNKKASMLEALKKQQEENFFDSERRKQLLDSLGEDSLTYFLSNLSGDDVADKPPHEVSENEAPAREEEVAWDDYQGQWPRFRPHFISPWHWDFMKNHFRLHPPFNSTWIDTYLRTPPVSESPKPKVSKATRQSSDSEGKDLQMFGKPLHPDGTAERPFSTAFLRYNEFILANQVLCTSVFFNTLVVGCIVIAGVLVGVQSYPSMDGDPGIEAVDLAVQIVFTIECVVKIAAQGRFPLKYWTGSDRYWNNFDFWLVLVVWLPFDGGNVGFLRLLRLMRLLKLVGKVKQLQVIVMGLVKGLSSVSYIMVLMGLFFYLFAVMGVGQFRENDPFHFGGLGVAMLTLFRCATLEDWSDVMYINYYGCDSQYGGVNGVYYGANGGAPYDSTADGGSLGKANQNLQTSMGDFPVAECWSPVAQPLFSTVFFIFFVLIAAFVIMSLFVGAVCGGMYEAIDVFRAQEAEEKERLKARIEAEAKEMSEDATAGAAQHYDLGTLRDAFDAFDEDGSGLIEAEELRQILLSLGDTKATVESAQAMINRVDQDGDGTLDVTEFIIMMTVGELEGDGTGSGSGGERRRSSVEGVTGAVADASLKAAAEARKFLEREKSRALFLVAKIRRAWRAEEEQKYDWDAIESDHLKAYLKWSVKAQELAEHPMFVSAMTATIIAAGVVVGIQTELADPAHPDRDPNAVLEALDLAILLIFTFEVVVKVVAEGNKPLQFFSDSWNVFDFVVVFGCFVFMLPVLPDVGSMLAMLRLLRLLRVLKLVKALPQLRIIIEALISGFGSITFVTIIVFMFFYLFAIVGMLLFGDNDPMHFGNLQTALVTLFRSATLDDWSDLMYINMFGCDVYGYEFGRPKYGFDAKGVRKKDHVSCNHPNATGWLAGFLMVVFTVLGALVLLTLFIGVVVTAMEEAKEEHKQEEKKEEVLARRCVALGIPPMSLELYRDIFDFLDDGAGADVPVLPAGAAEGAKKVKTGMLDRDALKPLMRALPHIREELASVDEADSDGDGGGSVSARSAEKAIEQPLSPRTLSVSKTDLEKLIQAVDENYTGNVEFSEFLVLMDFMRRADENPEVLLKFREACERVAPGRSRVHSITSAPTSPAPTEVHQPNSNDRWALSSLTSESMPSGSEKHPPLSEESPRSGEVDDLKRQVQQQLNEIDALRRKVSEHEAAAARYEATTQQLTINGRDSSVGASTSALHAGTLTSPTVAPSLTSGTEEEDEIEVTTLPLSEASGESGGQMRRGSSRQAFSFFGPSNSKVSPDVTGTPPSS